MCFRFSVFGVLIAVLLVACGSDPETSQVKSTPAAYVSSEFDRENAGARIVRKGNYVYLKTPYAYVHDKKKVTMIKQSMKILAAKLQQIVPETEYKPAVLEQISQSYQAIDQSIDQLFYHTLVIDKEGFRSVDLLPTAILVYVGGVFSKNTAVGGGGSASLGIVMQPFLVQRIDIVTKEEITYHEFHSAWIGWPNVNLGVGVGGGGRLRAGFGIIWGDLEHPRDFVGPVLAVSKSAVFNVGFNIKVGALHQWGTSAWFQNPFVIVGFESGLTATAEIHANLSYVIDAQVMMGALGFDMNQDQRVIMLPETIDPSQPTVIPMSGGTEIEAVK